MHSSSRQKKGYWAGALAVVGVVFGAAAVQAAVISPNLATELVMRAPQDEIAVIVSLSNKLDRRLYKLSDRSKRNTLLVRALKEKAAATQTVHRVFL